MKFLWFLLIVLIFNPALSTVKQDKVLRFLTGDIILLPLDCRVCEMIEDETGTPYSHSGIVINDEMGHPMVAEALGDVHLISVEEFLSRLPHGKEAMLFRSVELAYLYIEDEFDFYHYEQNLRRDYFERYHGLKFDSAYKWDNFDKDSRELLYCTEMITKLLNPYLTDKIPVKPMSFDRNWAFWSRYFLGKVPQGELGNSPADIAKHEGFYQVRPLGKYITIH